MGFIVDYPACSCVVGVVCSCDSLFLSGSFPRRPFSSDDASETPQERLNVSETSSDEKDHDGRYLVNVLLNPLGRDFQTSCPECVGLFTGIYPSETFSRSCGVSEG